MNENFKLRNLDTKYFLDYNLNKKTKDVLHILKSKIERNLNYLKKNKIMDVTKVEFTQNKKFVQDGKYFDKSITDDINSKTTYKIVIKYSTYNGIAIDFNFYVLSNNIVSEQKIYNYANLMTSWLMIAKDYEVKECVKNLKVDIYLTKNKKELPTSKHHILGAKEVNSAYTYRCHHDDSSITLYREEDLMKVFFHETFHTFNFDFVHSAKQEIQYLFSINSDVNLFESYCETWARIINSLYYSTILEEKENVNFIKSINSVLAIESLYSLNQSIKILNHMNISFRDMINNNEVVRSNFRENSNIFSYYFVTALLMINIDYFISFCCSNPNYLHFEESNLSNYIKLIERIKKEIQIGEKNDIINKIISNKTRTVSTKMAIFDVMDLL